MRKVHLAAAWTAAAAMAAVLGVGCANNTKQAPQVKTAVFYPEPPFPPRLQFLTSFSDTRRWASAPRSSFADWIAGTGKKADEGDIRSPYGIAAHGGKLYICDLGARCVHVINLAGKGYAKLGTRQQVEKPVNITITPDGTKYVCDTQKAMIAVFDAADRFVRHVGDPTRGTPIDVAVLGEELIVVDAENAEVKVWDMQGKLLRTIATKGRSPNQVLAPTNVAIALDGRIYVSDTGGSIVNRYDRQGRFLGSVGGPGDRPGFFARPKGLAVDPEGRLYVADSQWEFVQIFSPEGRILLAFGGARPGPESMGLPAGLAVDASCLPYFQPYLDKDFQAEYLLFVTNQFGNNKVGVYAFGKSRTADYTPRTPRSTTREAGT